MPAPGDEDEVITRDREVNRPGIKSCADRKFDAKAELRSFAGTEIRMWTVELSPPAGSRNETWDTGPWMKRRLPKDEGFGFPDFKRGLR